MEPDGTGTQERVMRYLERVPPAEVLEAAGRYTDHPEARALALARIERARIAAEEANDGAAVDALISLRDMERAGEGPGGAEDDPAPPTA
jgi:hypothetical protein